jgi:hypothetical protein
MRGSLLRTLPFSLVALACIVTPSNVAGEDAGADLIARYQRESSELVKRNLVLKMIDAGVLQRFRTRARDLANIFAADWAPDMKVDQHASNR